MDYRTLGRTGLRVGALGFGCGNVGGLLIRGTPAERERAVARALELGINYFDTAPIYGDGQSETNLGQVIRALKPRLYVGTKFRVPDVPAAELPAAVARSLEESLKRLGLPRVDLLQCHNLVTRGRTGRGVSVKDMGDAIVPALIRLVEQGKIGFYGMTALGETAALHEVLDAGLVQTAQVCFNLLNPSAAHALPPQFPAQDFGRLLDHAAKSRVGVIVIRALAAGALSGTEARHPTPGPTVDPIALRSVHDPETVAAIRAGMDEYAILVFHDQPFADDEQLAFAQRLDGALHTKLGSAAIQKNRFGNEALGDISNVGADGEILKSDDRRRAYSLGNRLWHTDASFQDPPGRYSMLHAQLIPPAGADTQYADMRAAAAPLPAATTAQIDGLRVHHSIAYSRQTLRFDFSKAEEEAPKGAIHPLVRTIPPAGRRAVY